MTALSHDGNTLSIDGRQLQMPYKIREAVDLGSKIIVLLDPNSYLQDPSYSRERRRGSNALPNLLAVSREGDVLWESELPEAADYYYRITSNTPLVVLSFSSFQCELDPETGRIRSKQFLK